jgi:hypothetical protein
VAERVVFAAIAVVFLGAAAVRFATARRCRCASLRERWRRWRRYRRILARLTGAQLDAGYRVSASQYEMYQQQAKEQAGCPPERSTQ